MLLGPTSGGACSMPPWSSSRTWITRERRSEISLAVPACRERRSTSSSRTRRRASSRRTTSSPGNWRLVCERSSPSDARRPPTGAAALVGEIVDYARAEPAAFNFLTHEAGLAGPAALARRDRLVAALADQLERPAPARSASASRSWCPGGFCSAGCCACSGCARGGARPISQRTRRRARGLDRALPRRRAKRRAGRSSRLGRVMDVRKQSGPPACGAAAAADGGATACPGMWFGACSGNASCTQLRA